MTAKVTEQGLQIPKSWLGDAEEVEVRRENGTIIIETRAASNDSIFELGREPVAAEVDDASTRHDFYL